MMSLNVKWDEKGDDTSDLVDVNSQTLIKKVEDVSEPPPQIQKELSDNVHDDDGYVSLVQEGSDATNTLATPHPLSSLNSRL